MKLLYGLCILYASCLYCMEQHVHKEEKEEQSWLSLKRLSYVLGYHKAKNLGKSVQVLQFDQKFSDFLYALKKEVSDVYTYIILLAKSDKLKKYYMQSYTFYKPLSKHKKLITSLAFDQQTKYLYAGSKNGYLRKWDITQPTRLKKYKMYTQAIAAITVAPLSQQLFVGLENGETEQWDISTKKRKNNWHFHKDYITTIILNKEETQFYSGSGDKKVYILDFFKNRGYYSPKIHTIRSLFLDQFTHNIIVGIKCGIEIWDINYEKKEIKVEQTDHQWKNTLSCFTIDPKTGYYIYSLCNKNSIYFYDPHTQKNIHSLKHSHEKDNHWVINFTVDNDSASLYSTVTDKTINIWKPKINLQQAINHCDLTEWLILKTVKKDGKILKH